MTVWRFTDELNDTASVWQIWEWWLVMSTSIYKHLNMSIYRGYLVIVLPKDELWWFRAVPDHKLKTFSALKSSKVDSPDHTREVHQKFTKKVHQKVHKSSPKVHQSGPTWPYTWGSSSPPPQCKCQELPEFQSPYGGMEVNQYIYKTKDFILFNFYLFFFDEVTGSATVSQTRWLKTGVVEIWHS